MEPWRSSTDEHTADALEDALEDVLEDAAEDEAEEALEDASPSWAQPAAVPPASRARRQTAGTRRMPGLSAVRAAGRSPGSDERLPAAPGSPRRGEVRWGEAGGVCDEAGSAERCGR
jgi:hypothetical protein